MGSFAAYIKQYDISGNAVNGVYVDIFEEEYRDVVENMQIAMGEDKYS
ncbi:MAG: hypothetical protein LKI17_06855 [Megasphaera cerevisiae]|jgi:type III restriction enzyme|nr:hypothetical protein [Megasphaera cerevisiae]